MDHGASFAMEDIRQRELATLSGGYGVLEHTREDRRNSLLQAEGFRGF
jgi:hypothetical protein